MGRERSIRISVGSEGIPTFGDQANFTNGRFQSLNAHAKSTGGHTIIKRENTYEISRLARAWGCCERETAAVWGCCSSVHAVAAATCIRLWPRLLLLLLLRLRTKHSTDWREAKAEGVRNRSTEMLIARKGIRKRM